MPGTHNNKEEGTNTLRLCASWPQARTRTDCKILGCHYLTRHALEHTRGQHSKERKPSFRLSAKKPPDQIGRPEDYSLQHYRETPSGILQLCVGPSHTREDPRDRDGPEKSSSLCEKELQKHIQRWRYAQRSQLADPRNQKEEPETHHDVQDTQQPGWN